MCVAGCVYDGLEWSPLWSSSWRFGHNGSTQTDALGHVCAHPAKLENLLQTVKGICWHWRPDTGFETQARRSGKYTPDQTEYLPVVEKKHIVYLKWIRQLHGANLRAQAWQTHSANNFSPLIQWTFTIGYETFTECCYNVDKVRNISEKWAQLS